MKTGFSLGLISAALAMAAGFYFAWRGFHSGPYDRWDLGAFWGSLCAILGITCGAMGAIAGHAMAHRRTSGRIASWPDAPADRCGR